MYKPTNEEIRNIIYYLEKGNILHVCLSCQTNVMLKTKHKQCIGCQSTNILYVTTPKEVQNE